MNKDIFKEIDRNDVVLFEKNIREAVEDKYTKQISDPVIYKSIIQDSLLLKFDLLIFYDLYKISNRPQERLSSLMGFLFDIKLQLYYILEFHSGLYNVYLYNKNPNRKKWRSYEKLIEMSLTQDMIVKNRILWEKMINFVSIYIDGTVKKRRRSKKGAFWVLIKNTPWEFLESYKETLKWFDDNLRNPEVHTNSILRSSFLKNEDKKDLDIINDPNILCNITINMFYPNIISIVKNLKPSVRTWIIGMKEDLF